MHGERPADVVLVRIFMSCPWSATSTHRDYVLKVASGHLLRAFAKRWLKYPLEFPLSMMLEPGAIDILR